MKTVLLILTGYLFGCFQSAYIIVRLSHGTDIRDIGSGNAGTMNVLMNYGIREAVPTFLFDIMKTVLCCAVCVYAFSKTDYYTVISCSCLGVALGHEFPFYMRFRGGKGIAVAIGFMILFDLRILGLSLVFAALVSVISGKLTVGSIGLAVTMGLSAALLYPSEVSFAVVIQALLIVALHIRDMRKKGINKRKKRKIKN